MKSARTKLTVAAVVVVALFGLLAGTAAAQDQAVTVEPATGLADGDTIVVNITGFGAGAEVTLAQCGVWPVAGPTDCDLATFGDYVIVADDAGAGSGEFVVFVGTRDAVTCNAETPCYIVASDGIGADSVAAGVEITFAGEAAPEETPTEEATEAPTEEATETPTEEATETATPEQISEMPQTGGESGMLAIIGVSVVIAGALFVGLGRRLGKI